MGIDVQSGGVKRPGPRRLRRLAKRAGPVTTRAEDADQAVKQLSRARGFKKRFKYNVKLQRPWAEAEKALRNRRAVHIAIDYGVVNRNRPRFSSQRSFNEGHSILLFGIRKNKKTGKGWEIGVNDPLAGRRRWWPLGLVRHAAGRIAGKPRHFYGGIFVPGILDGKTVAPAHKTTEAEDSDIQDGTKQIPAPGEAVTNPSCEFADDADDKIDDDESGITDGNLSDPEYPRDDPLKAEMGSLTGDVDPASE
jgi:hypothetical protein